MITIAYDIVLVPFVNIQVFIQLQADSISLPEIYKIIDVIWKLYFHHRKTCVELRNQYISEIGNYHKTQFLSTLYQWSRNKYHYQNSGNVSKIGFIFDRTDVLTKPFNVENTTNFKQDILFFSKWISQHGR